MDLGEILDRAIIVNADNEIEHRQEKEIAALKQEILTAKQDLFTAYTQLFTLPLEHMPLEDEDRPDERFKLLVYRMPFVKVGNGDVGTAGDELPVLRDILINAKATCIHHEGAHEDELGNFSIGAYYKVEEGDAERGWVQDWPQPTYGDINGSGQMHLLNYIGGEYYIGSQCKFDENDIEELFSDRKIDFEITKLRITGVITDEIDDAQQQILALKTILDDVQQQVREANSSYTMLFRALNEL